MKSPVLLTIIKIRVNNKITIKQTKKETCKNLTNLPEESLNPSQINVVKSEQKIIVIKLIQKLLKRTGTAIIADKIKIKIKIK